jgi:hypothetical protein
MTPLDINDIETNAERFIIECVESGIVWGLESDEGWATCPSVTDESIDVMPFFSSRIFAAELCCEEWETYEPRALDIEEFLDDWLPGLHEDVILVGMNWTSDMNGVEEQPLDLAEALEEEIDEFQKEQDEKAPKSN